MFFFLFFSFFFFLFFCFEYVFSSAIFLNFLFLHFFFCFCFFLFFVFVVVFFCEYVGCYQAPFLSESTFCHIITFYGKVSYVSGKKVIDLGRK